MKYLYIQSQKDKMLTLEQCKALITNEFIKDISQVENVSKLMNQSRSDNKWLCIQNFGSVTEINNFLSEVKNNPSLQIKTDIDQTINSIQTTSQTANDTIQDKFHGAAEIIPNAFSDISSGVSSTSDIVSLLQTIWIWVLYAILGILAISIIIKLTKYILRRGYAFLNADRLVYMKVIAPRWDSKSDREQSKDIAKDMKEKVSRMSQVFSNIQDIGSLSFSDRIKKFFFRKPRVVFMYHYEKGKLSFIVGTFPEYKKIIESAIGSQYPNVSIETIKNPNTTSKKHYKIMPMQTSKQSVYTINLFKRMEDDPMNNIIDAMRNVSVYDTATVIMPMKPVWISWNNKAKRQVERLYKNLSITETPFWHYIIMPWKIFTSGNDDANKKVEDITMVRMVKSKEDTINDMAEQVGKAAYEVWLMIVSSSDNKTAAEKNVEWIVSSYNVYDDNYWNDLIQLENKASLLWFISKPLWTIAMRYRLTNLFFNSNTFTVDEISSLFHFPDSTYNPSNIIDWLQYKLLPPPQNTAKFDESDFGGYIMSGVVAENYNGWKLTKTLQEYKNHRAVGKKRVSEEKLIEADKLTQQELQWKEVIEKDGKKFAKITSEKDVYWYKIYKWWVLLGTNIYRNKYTPIYMKRDDRTRHHYCVGKSGTWKSVYLQTLARQDIWNGDGVCVVDPHGDLVEDLLEFIPKERAKDVIFFDAGNEERPMGLNLYEIESLDEADRAVNDATEIFIKMFGPEIFGPRIQEYFKYGSLTLLEDFEDRPTLLDVTRLYTDDAYRDYKVSKVTNAVVKNFREKTYNAMGDREKAEIIPYFSSKFVSFNTNRLIRNIIGQTHSAFDIADVMNNKKILLISLSKGKIWDMNAQLLWMVLVSKIYNAAMARARMPKEDRKDFYLYVDEFQNFVSSTFADILSEARKYRLSLIMAHQYIAQLEWGWGWMWDKWGWKWDVKAAVFGNVWTMQSFKIWAADAEFLEKEYTPVLSAWDIVWIANYKSYIKLNINNSTTRPFSMNSIYTNDYQNKKIPAILKEYSAKKYWRKRDFVDAEITARFGLDVEEESLPETPENTETPTQQPQQEQTPPN